MLCRPQKARSDNFGYFSHSKPKDPNHPKSHCYRTRVKFCFKDKVRMEQKEQTGDPNGEGTNGGNLRDLASKWFIDTQVPLIVNNGLFPSWFMGFTSRKDAENLLKDKELGCYLIRLSDKAIGYILSYKGRDRFRHFVISQSVTGQFVVSGDNEGHDTVLKLIEHYKTIPIEPFGEYLTFPCFKDHSEDLYDIIRVSPKDKPEAVLRAAKNLQKQKTASAPDHQPAWQPKGNKTEEEVPPLPRRSRHLDSGPFTDEQDGVVYAQLKKQTVKEKPRIQHVQQDNLPEVSRRKVESSNAKNRNNGRCSPPSAPESVYTELNPLDSKSKSLPLLDSSSDTEQCYRLRVPPDTPPRLSPKPIRQAASYAPQSNSSQSLDGMSDNAVYHLAGPASFNNRSSTAQQQSNSLYAEVAIETPVLNQDDTYELIPDQKEPVKPNSSYEPVEDSKRKFNYSSWGIKNDKWKWLFPEAKRKW
ncbi:SH2 domain-containing protein 7 isoform X2 [Austrofundulus limnaeus]|nr:PREDICTED: SH2 domain-containing protein 7-like isoform X2 [Austrofundulus limnaeus]